MTAQPTEAAHRFALELLDEAIEHATGALELLERRRHLPDAARKLRLAVAKLEVVRAQARRERHQNQDEGSTTATIARQVGRESGNSRGCSG